MAVRFYRFNVKDLAPGELQPRYVPISIWNYSSTSDLGSRVTGIPSKADVHVSGVTCKMLPLGVDAGQSTTIAAYIYILDTQAIQFKLSYGTGHESC